MQFALLGPLVVCDDTGAQVPIAGARQRALLATLLLRANTPVSVDGLTEAVWDGSPPRGYPATLRSHIKRLREALDEQGAASRIITRDPGYLIRLDDAELDLRRFEALCQDTDAALRRGAWDEASDAAAWALGLWRAEPLLDVPSSTVRDQAVSRLDQLRVQLLEQHVQADLHRGRHEQLVPDLRELTARYPLRERFHAQLMLALARAGRQAEALAAFQDARRVLVAELGIEPGPELRAVQERVLAGEYEAAVAVLGEAVSLTDAASLSALVTHVRGALQAPGPGPAPVAGDSAEGATWTQCPYPGLAPFSVGQARVFFGRREMTRRLVKMVAQRAEVGGLLVVLGASGAGKSSLLRAGLVPALADDGLGAGSGAWPVRVLTPTGRPLAELAARLAALTGGDAREVEQVLRVAPQRAADMAAEALAGARSPAGGGRPVLVLVVDQFEEVFSLAAPDEGALFVQALHALAAVRTGSPGTASAPPAVVLVAVRGDYLDQALLDPGTAQAVGEGPFVVEAMTRAQLREAIEAPAAEAGVPVERELVTTILDEALGGGAGPGGQVLPLVSQALAETWRMREGGGLTIRAYHRGGGLAEAADRGAQEVFDGLDAVGRKAARAMFMLLTRTGTDGRVARRTATRAQLHAAAGLSASEGDAVIDAFAARRLLVVEQGGVAICHDVLLDAWRRLRDWLQGDAADRALYSEVIQDAQSWQDGQREVYGRRRLALIGEAAARWTPDPERYPPLPALAAGFLSASKRAAARATWRRRAAVAALVALAATATGFAADARANTHQADAQHRIALSRQLAADSATVEETDPELAQQLAVSAWAAAPTSQAKQQVSTLLSDDGLTGTLPLPAISQAVAFSPDGSILAAGVYNGTVRLWDAATGRLRTIITDTTDLDDGGVSSLAFSPDGSILAVGADDGTVRLWDPATGRLRIAITDTTEGGVSSVAFSPDGGTLAVGADDGTVRLWDPATGHPRVTITDMTDLISAFDAGGVSSVAFSPDGRTLAVGGHDGSVRLWDPATGVPGIAITDTAAGTSGGVSSLEFSPDGGALAVGGADGTVRLWNPGTGQPAATITDTTDTTPSTDLTATVDSSSGVSSVAFSPDGQTLAVGAHDGTVQLWGLGAGRPHTTITDTDNPGTDGVFAVAFSPDGHTLAASADAGDGDGNGSVRLWNPSTGEPHATMTAITDTTGAVSSVAFGPDGSMLAVGAADGTIRLWNPATGQPLTTITDTTATGGVDCVAFSPNGRMLAVGAADGTIQLWNPGTGQPLTTITDSSGAVNSMAFSPNGRMLAAGSDNGTFRLWDPASGQPLATISDTSAAGATVNSVAFSPDGRTLAVAASDGSIRFWNPNTEQVSSAMTDDGTVATSLMFSPDGSTLAIGADDGTVGLWDMRTQQEHIMMTATTDNSGVFSVAYSPDGSTLVVGAGDGTVQLWDPASGQLLSIITDTTAGAVSSAVFSPDGRSFASGAGDGRVIVRPTATFTDPYQVMCSNGGSLSGNWWDVYAPGEQQPTACVSP